MRNSKGTKQQPLIDLQEHARLETATFALG